MLECQPYFSCFAQKQMHAFDSQVVWNHSSPGEAVGAYF